MSPGVTNVFALAIATMNVRSCEWCIILNFSRVRSLYGRGCVLYKRRVVYMYMKNEFEEYIRCVLRIQEKRVVHNTYTHAVDRKFRITVQLQVTTWIFQRNYRCNRLIDERMFAKTFYLTILERSCRKKGETRDFDGRNRKLFFIKRVSLPT